MDDEDHDALVELVRRHGLREVTRALQSMDAAPVDPSPCTIICDDTLHHVPDLILKGQTYVFSSGNFDVSSNYTVKRHLESRVDALIDFLKVRQWSSVRIIFTGHAILGATVKHVVYRVSHLETEDFIYFGSEGYRRVKLDLRGIATKRA